MTETPARAAMSFKRIMVGKRVSTFPQKSPAPSSAGWIGARLCLRGQSQQRQQQGARAEADSNRAWSSNVGPAPMQFAAQRLKKRAVLKSQQAHAVTAPATGDDVAD